MGRVASVNTEYPTSLIKATDKILNILNDIMDS